MSRDKQLGSQLASILEVRERGKSVAFVQSISESARAVTSTSRSIIRLDSDHEADCAEERTGRSFHQSFLNVYLWSPPTDLTTSSQAADGCLFG